MCSVRDKGRFSGRFFRLTVAAREFVFSFSLPALDMAFSLFFHFIGDEGSIFFLLSLVSWAPGDGVLQVPVLSSPMRKIEKTVFFFFLSSFPRFRSLPTPLLFL